MNLDNLKDIMRLDRENMLRLLVSFPGQCREAIKIGERINVPFSYRKGYVNVIFTGLGGSAIGADIVCGITEEEIKVPIFVNRNYTLPHFTGKNSLVFAISYSGNTEETLSAYADAKKRGSNIIAITSGGKLKELAVKNKDVLILIPQGYPPRAALGYSFIPAIFSLSKLGLIKEKRNDLLKTTVLLKEMQGDMLGAHVHGRKNIAKETAKKIHGSFPVIYASSRMESVMTRWKGQFAENGKHLSSGHVFPEMNHNEIVGWVYPKNILRNFLAIILRDRFDHPRVQKRMDITYSILKKAQFEVIEIESNGASLIERMLSLVVVGDFISFYLAILNGIDPTPVERITYLKKQLAK
ncbi:MAG: bifunctional phosphoglucose/phosphomannose isomerase [Candidatus Omnitrophica bacterium]|nr:bifunctional phosphoglucose/phosphomannose isomerase [Candidatus Omnitrophota bacterium]